MEKIFHLFIIFLLYASMAQGREKYATPSPPSQETILSAESGSADAQYKVAMYMLRPLAGADSWKIGLEWLERAAKGGCKEAQYEMGIRSGGTSSVRLLFPDKVWNFKSSEKWLKLAASQGHTGAQYALADMYRFGIYEKNGLNAIRADSKEYAKLILSAAALGHEPAQVEAAMLYHSGGVVVKNDYLSSMWLAKAAAQGNIFSQRELGVNYYNGIGVPRNFSKSYAWIKLSAQNENNLSIGLLDGIENRLSSRDKKIADIYLARWKVGDDLDFEMDSKIKDIQKSNDYEKSKIGSDNFLPNKPHFIYDVNSGETKACLNNGIMTNCF